MLHEHFVSSKKSQKSFVWLATMNKESPLANGKFGAKRPFLSQMQHLASLKIA